MNNILERKEIKKKFNFKRMNELKGLIKMHESETIQKGTIQHGNQNRRMIY